MGKIITLIKIILRVKFVFKTPERNDLILFDDTSSFDLQVCLSKFSFFVLQTRTDELTKIYVSYKILKNVFKNFFKGNLFTAYLVSLIELINPKVVITNIDNSFKFSDIAKILEKKSNFVAIQNSGSYELLEFDYLYKNKKIKKNYLDNYYIPIFFSYGGYEKDLYNQIGVKVKKMYPLGSLRWSNFLNHIKKANNYSPKNYECDICLIADALRRSQAITALDPLDKNTKKKLSDPKLPINMNIVKGYIEIARYTMKFCIKNNMKLIIPQKTDPKISKTYKDYQGEIDFFKKNFTKDEFDYYKKHVLENVTDDYSSYRVVLNSKVTVGAMSTLLREKLGAGGKMLSCNLTKADMYNFPFSGICSLNDCTYEEFEKRLLKIYHMTKEEYFSKVDQKPDYINKLDKNHSTIDLIREKLYQMGVKQSE